MSALSSSPTRRSFLVASAAAGAAGVLSSQSPAATSDAAVRPFRVNVPEEALADLRRRINATRWPDQETVMDESQGVQLATMQEFARYSATGYDWRNCEAKLNSLPQFMTEIDGLDIHFIHVRSQHENALPLIVTHGRPGSVIEQLKIIDPLTNPAAHGASESDAFPPGYSLDTGLRLFSQADHDRLGPFPNGARLGRADEAPWLHAICGARRRCGRGRLHRYGQTGAAGIARHSHQFSRDHSPRHCKGAPGGRPAAIGFIGR
jgi:Epoxide hydrolase N terminus/TAT (twin-arginine translocation) pathway signal sequence